MDRHGDDFILLLLPVQLMNNRARVKRDHLDEHDVVFRETTRFLVLKHESPGKLLSGTDRKNDFRKEARAQWRGGLFSGAGLGKSNESSVGIEELREDAQCESIDLLH